MSSFGGRTAVIVIVVLGLALGWTIYMALDYRAHVNVFLEKYTRVVEEFSERKYFAEANQGLRSDTTIPNRVVFFGTQVVNRWPLESSFPNYEVIDRGVPGQRLSGMLLRFRPDVIELGSEVVLIEISSYNFREESSIAELFDYAQSMAELARCHGIKPIMTTLIPHVEGYEVYESDYDVIDSIEVYAEWMRLWCAEEGIALVDFNGLMANEQGFLREELASNAVEPNAEGYALLSEAVTRTLDSLVQDQ